MTFLLFYLTKQLTKHPHRTLIITWNVEKLKQTVLFQNPAAFFLITDNLICFYLHFSFLGCRGSYPAAIATVIQMFQAWYDLQRGRLLFQFLLESSFLYNKTRSFIRSLKGERKPSTNDTWSSCSEIVLHITNSLVWEDQNNFSCFPFKAPNLHNHETGIKFANQK